MSVKKGDDDNGEAEDLSDSEASELPTAPTSPIYNITLSPLSPDVLPDSKAGLDVPESPSGLKQVSRC